MKRENKEGKNVMCIEPREARAMCTKERRSKTAQLDVYYDRWS
jgi:hypothetical protein